MIELSCLGPDGALALHVDPRVLARRTARADMSSRIVDALACRLPEGTLRTSSGCLRDLPHTHGLVAFGAGHIDSARGELLLSRVIGIGEDVLRRVGSGKPSLLQDDSLLPTTETRSATIVLAPEAAALGPGALDATIDRIAASTGSGWSDFLGIVTVVTFVGVAGRKEIPYFSGSTSDLWGAVHLAWPRSDAVLAESLTHEAAHLWLMLAEEVEPLCEDAWCGRLWDSPWRDDPRPLGGIVHGAFAFSCASLALASMVRDGRAGQEVPDRIARITAQVDAAARECRGSKALAPLGERVIAASLDRIASARKCVHRSAIDSAAECVEAEQLAKRARRRAEFGATSHG